MTRALHISAHVTLPLELAARTTAILAQKGAGKTYAAMRITEELLTHDQQVVALDPTGVWWGLRAPREKAGMSFPVIVLGGEHQDAPLEPTAGAIVARFAVESGRSLVLDMSGFESNGAQDRFATDFALALYRLKATQRATLHVMVDEADSFAPQRPLPGQQQMLGAFEAIVRRGRSRGLGMTLISQRPAVLNKNVLSQADLLIAMRVVGVHDFKALAEWAAMYGTKKQLGDFLETLPTLKTGEAWFWSPSWLSMFKRGTVSRRATFDSSSTPAPGERRETPAMGAVDLVGLSAEIASSVERAKANDPKLLQRRVRELESAVAAAKLEASKKVAPEPVLSASDKAALFTSLTAIQTELLAVGAHLIAIKQEFDPVMSKIAKLADRINVERSHALDTARMAEVGGGTLRHPAKPIRPEGVHRVSADPIPRKTPGPSGNGADLGKCERAILTVLKQYAPAPVEKTRVALIAGYASNGGGFNNSLGSLRSKGCIEAGDPVRITALGESTIGDVPPLPTGRELLEYWKRELGGASAKVLAALDERQGQANKQLIATLAGYEVSGGGFNNALGKLRTLKLISGSKEIHLAEDLR